VFVIGYLGDWRPAAAVLLDFESLSWNPAPGRSAGKGTAGGFEVGPAGGCQTEVSCTLDTGCKDGAIRNQAGMLINEIANPLEAICGDYSRADGFNIIAEKKILCINNRPNELGYKEEHSHTLRATDYKTPPIICYETGQGFWQEDAISGTVKVNGAEPTTVVCLAENMIGRKPKNGCNGKGYLKDIAFTLNTAGIHAVNYNTTVRRLTPLECERLMGFPDFHTRITWNGKPEEACPDSHRYKACGNSMCVNVMRWIGMRINIVDELLKEIKKQPGVI
jgi:DNA (cytosine-5)-methyltransferase 1